MNMKCVALVLSLAALPVSADDSTVDAAIGGGIGGAVGAAVGNEIAGRDGAIIGGAVGAAAGAGVATEGAPPAARIKIPKLPVYESDGHHHGHFCPPGQAKKGRC